MNGFAFFILNIFAMHYKSFKTLATFISFNWVMINGSKVDK